MTITKKLKTMTEGQVELLVQDLKELLKKHNLGHTILVTTHEEGDEIVTNVSHLKQTGQITNHNILLVDKILTRYAEETRNEFQNIKNKSHDN